MSAGPFEHFMVLIRKSFRTKSHRRSTRMHEIVESLGSALDSVRKPGSEIHGGVADASPPRKRSAWRVKEGFLCVIAYVCL